MLDNEIELLHSLTIAPTVPLEEHGLGIVLAARAPGEGDLERRLLGLGLGLNDALGGGVHETDGDVLGGDLARLLGSCGGWCDRRVRAFVVRQKLHQTIYSWAYTSIMFQRYLPCMHCLVLAIGPCYCF